MKISIDLDGKLLTYLKEKSIKENTTIEDLIEESIYILKMVETIENKDIDSFTELYIKYNGDNLIRI